VLSELYAGSLADAELRLEQIPISLVEQRALSQIPALDALSALAPSQDVKILAEVKRASPSRGEMAEIPDPAALAQIYAQHGASAISVLTEERKFKGSLRDLELVRGQVDVPLLRKDFIATEHQILEARAAGADIVLLIVAGLTASELARLMHFTIQLGMTPFVETHSRDELKLALDSGSTLVGVNARDLSTFQTDRNLFGELVGIIPNNVIKVAESAVRGPEDVRHYRDAGADVVLVGEALVTGDPGKMLESFLASGKS